MIAMDKLEILLFIIIAILVIFLLRLPVIDLKVRRYVKKYHRDYWEANISSFLVGGRISVFQIVEKLHDPKISEYRKNFDSALKHLIIAVVCMFMLIIVLVILKMI